MEDFKSYGMNPKTNKVTIIVVSTLTWTSILKKFVMF